MMTHSIRKVAQVAVLTALGLFIPAPRAMAESLAEALAAAYDYSGLLDQNRALLRAADEDVATSLSALRPVIDFVTSLSRSFNRTRINSFTANDDTLTLGTVSLTASLLLYDNGSSRFTTQAAEEIVLATRNALLSVEQQVLLRAVVAYMNVIQAIEFVDLRQNNLRVLEQEFQAARDRFEVGEVTRTDVALAEARVAEARSNLATARGDLVNAEQEYIAAVGQQPGQLEPPPPLPTLPETIDAIQEIARRRHPEILQAQHEVASNELAVLARQADLGPTVSLQGDLSYSESTGNERETEDASISLTMNQRLYQGGALASGLRRAMATRDAARANLFVTTDNIEEDAANALIGFRVAQANIAATDERIAAATVAFEGTREEATLGARTTLDVLQTEDDLLDARAARIAAQTELYIAAYEILAAQGALTAQDLGLNVQIYDPAAYYNQVKTAPAFLSDQGQRLDRVLRALNRD